MPGRWLNASAMFKPVTGLGGPLSVQVSQPPARGRQTAAATGRVMIKSGVGFSSYPLVMHEKMG